MGEIELSVVPAGSLRARGGMVFTTQAVEAQRDPDADVRRWGHGLVVTPFRIEAKTKNLYCDVSLSSKRGAKFVRLSMDPKRYKELGAKALREEFATMMLLAKTQLSKATAELPGSKR